MRTWMFVMLLTLAACESPRKADIAPVIDPSVTVADVTELVAKAQELRDRSFTQQPNVVAVDQLDPTVLVVSDACRKDRRWLIRTLFGFDDATAERAPWLPVVTHYDVKSNTLRFVRSARRQDITRDTILSVVRGVDESQFGQKPQASTWNEWLAQQAAMMSDGAFVWALQQQPELTVEALRELPSLAMRSPDLARSFEVAGSPGIDTLNRRELAFALREGLAFSAMLHRSGGWSSAEVAWIAPPTEAGYIVRPDRWAAGEGLGTWTLPKTKPNLSLEREGRVGVAVLSLWLSDFITPAIARSVYVSWQSDWYRVYSTDSGWWFEYVSLWRTPDDAQQMTQVLDAALKTRTDAGFTVVRNGATVVVVGSTSQGDGNQRLEVASLLAASSPAFAVLEKPLISFVPTRTDIYSARLATSQLDTTELTWHDDAAQLTLDLAALKDWQLAKADDLVARFLATKGDATILMSTELIDPAGPAFETEAFQDEVVANFRATLTSANVLAVKRVDGAIYAEMTGALGGDIHLAFWMIRNGDVLATFSVKAPPARFHAARLAAETVWNSRKIDAMTTDAGSESGDGVLQFEVDEH